MASPRFPQWEYDLLKAFGAPSSKNNLTALNLWAQSEGSVTNNPLATSGKGAGATKCVAQCGSTSPIYEYDNEADGVAQMASFLKGSYYTAIIRAFVQDAGLAAIYQAINSSPWCKGCQKGQYPVDLSQAVGGKGPSTSPTVGTGGSSNPGSAAGSSPGSGLSTCVIQFPGLLFFSGPCLLTKGGVKWLGAVSCIVVGGALATFGVILLASAVGKSTGATGAVTGAAKKGAKTIGIAGSLFAGQPELAAGIATTSTGGGKKAPAKTATTTRPARPTPERAARLEESNRIGRDIAATYRPNNRGLSRQPTILPRQSTHRQQDWAREKAAAEAKARAANF